MDIILKNRGNYKELLTFKKATVIYDLTYHFCQKYLKKGDRTIDQMIQAARSGKQNIAEGVAASSTNSETEIKLINVAKASLKELLTDFEDYLRTRGLRQWDPKGKEVTWLRGFARDNPDPAPYLAIAESRSDEAVANMAIALLKQEDYLLFRQLAALEEQYQESGDIKTRMKPIAKKAAEKNRDAAMREAASYGRKCPDCGGRLDNGTTYDSNQKIIFQWKCSKCGKTVKPDDPMEILVTEQERRKRVWEVKRIYGY